MIKNIFKSFLLLIIFIIIVGLLYPLFITGIAKIVSPSKSDGLLIYNNDRIIGSGLIGQNFTSNKYFHPRPSYAGQDGYDPMASGGSNLAPTNESFLINVKKRIEDFKKENNLPSNTAIPADILTASGSGLDPDISVESALMQIGRISSTRGIPESKLKDLVLKNTEDRLLGFLGEPKVNVLKLNLLLDNSY
jgi:potassium-transporting ATPase KdpC subunit